MLTPEDYRQLAERCALLAFECATPGIAEELRTLALDYLTRAVSPMGRGSDDGLYERDLQRERYLGSAFTLVLLEGLRLACEGS